MIPFPSQVPVSFSEFSIYFRAFFPDLPPLHWLIMSVVSAAVIVFMLIRRKGSSRGGSNTYNAVALGVTVFICLVLLDILLIHRFNADRPQQQCFNLLEEYRHIISGDEEYAYTMLFNVLLFIPLGLTLSEYLSSRRRGGFAAGEGTVEKVIISKNPDNLKI
ncbi:MAG: hypothetical protein IJK05_09770 [Bacteroidales bacterium]|nr:hypothetical protein [Bacteroidales bacterium]